MTEINLLYSIWIVVLECSVKGLSLITKWHFNCGVRIYHKKRSTTWWLNNDCPIRSSETASQPEQAFLKRVPLSIKIPRGPSLKSTIDHSVCYTRSVVGLARMRTVINGTAHVCTVVGNQFWDTNRQKCKMRCTWRNWFIWLTFNDLISKKLAAEDSVAALLLFLLANP